MKNNMSFISSKSKQIEWVNISKAFGVILVIFGHLLYKTQFDLLNKIIYSFHMPLFFVLSGYVFHLHKDERFSDFVRKKAKRLLVPTTIFVVLTLPLYFLINSNNLPSFFSFSKLLFFVNGNLPYNDPCWFFIVLFEIYIFAFFSFAYLREITVKLVVCMLSFSVISVLYFLNISNYLFLGLNRAILGFGFFLLGSILQDSCLFEKVNSVLKVFIAAISFVGLIVFGVVFNCKISMYNFTLGNIAFFILSGICGSICIMIISQFAALCFLNFNKFKSVVRWICNNSVIIIGTHYVLITLVNSFLFVLHMDKPTVYNALLVLFVTIIFAIYYPVCKFVNRYIPILSTTKERHKNESRKTS